LIKWLIQNHRPIKEEVLDVVVEEGEGILRDQATVETVEEEDAEDADVEVVEVVEEEEVVVVRMKKEHGFLSPSWAVS